MAWICPTSLRRRSMRPTNASTPKAVRGPPGPCSESSASSSSAGSWRARWGGGAGGGGGGGAGDGDVGGGGGVGGGDPRNPLLVPAAPLAEAFDLPGRLGAVGGGLVHTARSSPPPPALNRSVAGPRASHPAL